MNIRKLRTECPGWTWKSERSGMGWRYVGTRETEKVTVYAVARLCGPTDDDFCMEWDVDDGSTSCMYVTWWLKHRATPAPAESPPPPPREQGGEEA